MNCKTTFILCGAWILLFSCKNDTIFEGEDQIFYHQTNRPQLHFSIPTDWMGTPISSVFFEEEYHLFYEYTTGDDGQGLKHWGHAVSNDLCHWEHLDIALSPDELGEIYPGSVVVDWENTSGFSTNGEPPLVAIFTYNNKDKSQSQALAYSLDKGRTWSKYNENPVLTNSNSVSFHDPKVLWDGDNDHWLMVVSIDEEVLFYYSADLKNWKYKSAFGRNKGAGGAWQCPDLFSIFVPETGDKRWVLLSSIHDGAPNGGSGTQYFIGEFKDKRFKLDQEFAPFLRRRNDDKKAVWLDYGRDFHAGLSWSNLPEEDDRQLIMGWMNNWDYASKLPTKPWKGTLTLPRAIALHSTAHGPRIFQSFPEELKKLRKSAVETNITGEYSGNLILDCSLAQIEILLEAGVAQDSNTVIGFKLSNNDDNTYVFGYDSRKNQYFSDRTNTGNVSFSDNFATEIHYAPKQLNGSLISMHIMLDATSCEFIADDGLTVISDQFFPSKPFTKIEFFVDGLSVDVQQLEMFELEGIWD